MSWTAKVDLRDFDHNLHIISKMQDGDHHLECLINDWEERTDAPPDEEEMLAITRFLILDQPTLHGDFCRAAAIVLFLGTLYITVMG